MNNELLGIIGLVLCFTAYQQWFYLKQIQKLVDKMIAGNYSAYSQGQAHVNESLRPKEFRVEIPQDEGMDELAQLNQMIKPPF